MNDRDLPADDPRDWLSRARSDLKLANAEISGVLLEDFCLHAQQGAEKALKGLLIALGVRAPYTHDQYVEALAVASAVVLWVEQELGSRSG
ncbi:MAG: HEPN domain-containing protein [Actinomycetota bacterium]|nr:HEPN domain-containing protein [Actinomycetota bacterium]